MLLACNKFNIFSQNLAHGKYNLGSDTLKMMLSAAVPVATNEVKADITEIAAGFGYTAGGAALTITGSSQSSGLYTLSANQVVFQASGGAMAAFRGITLYDDTQTSPAKPCVFFYDCGSSITLNDGDSITLKFNSTNPGSVMTIS
jgi:hypothetical protein